MEAFENGYIDKNAAENIPSIKLSEGRAYGLPKAHKEVPENKALPDLRLVVSGNGSNTEGASYYVDHHSKHIHSPVYLFIVIETQPASF